MISKPILLSLLPYLTLTSAAVVCNFSVAASSGATCQSFASAWGQTVEAFEALNPGVTCPDLVAGQSYCVIGTVTEDPTTTTTSTSSTTSVPTVTSTSTTLTTTTTSTTTTSSSANEPTQPGIPSECDAFHLVESGDQCDTIEAAYGITDAQFKAWNPTIDDSCTNLWLGYYVCVHIRGATTTTSAPEPTATGPSPQMPGIISSCKTFYQVMSGDSCYSIYTLAGITAAQFLSWNSGIDDACSNLWLGYYVCTGV